MKALVGAFNQEKALVGAFSVIVQPVVEPMDRFAALIQIQGDKTKLRWSSEAPPILPGKLQKRKQNIITINFVCMRIMLDAKKVNR